jgi:uncharacterized protein YbjT (DUF2867 family)
MSDKNRIVVLGGNGKTGRRVVERLKARDCEVRAVSRSSDLPFDWMNRETWLPALSGCDAMYITYQPDLAVPNAPDDIRTLTDLAVSVGIKRVVLLSGRGEEAAQQCERIVQQSSLEWTIVRAGWFNQNFSESFLLEPIQAGDVVLPVGDVLEPFIDVEDIADVIVAALTEDGHTGQLYEVTGGRLMTFQSALAEIAAASGREIRFVSVPPEAYAAGMREAGLPEDYIALVTYLFTHVLDGRNAYLTDGVQRALGRPPRDFSEYVRDTVGTGIWDAQPIAE